MATPTIVIEKPLVLPRAGWELVQGRLSGWYYRRVY